MEDLTKAALVIPVHNRRETTLRCLRSLRRIDRSGLEVKIFVIDDGSTDGTSEAIRKEFPEVELITGDGSLHYAAGTNRGIERALAWNPDFVVTMNDDAVYHEDFLQRLIATAQENPRSIVGALLLLWDEPHKVFQVAPKWHTLQGGWTFPMDLTAFTVSEQPFTVESIVGNCVMFPVDAIREVGLMDEKNFPHGWGDAQYIMSMRKAGWNLFVDPRSLVWCEPNTNPKPLKELPLGDTARALFKNKRHPLNLGRQFTARWYSAPSRTQAAASFVVYCLQLAGKSAAVGLGRLFSLRPPAQVRHEN